jgi:carbon storage regulator CsrA
MLVLSRKCQEAVVVGGAGDGAPLLTVTVLEVVGTQVKLGFQADPSVLIHRREVWQRIHANGQADSPAPDPVPPGAG